MEIHEVESIPHVNAVEVDGEGVGRTVAHGALKHQVLLTVAYGEVVNGNASCPCNPRRLNNPFRVTHHDIRFLNLHIGCRFAVLVLVEVSHGIESSPERLLAVRVPVNASPKLSAHSLRRSLHRQVFTVVACLLAVE